MKREDVRFAFRLLVASAVLLTAIALLPAQVPPCIRSVIVTTCDGQQHDLTANVPVVTAVSAALGASPASQPSTAPTSPPATLPTSQPTSQPSAYVWSPVTPPLPTTFPSGYAVHVAGAVPKGYGIYSVNHTAAQAFSNIYITGFDQNGCSETYAGGLTIAGAISINALHDPANLFDGQGWYIEGVDGPISISASCFAWNGWQTGQPPAARLQYYHGLYINAPNSLPSISQCLFASNSACQIQTRAGGNIDSCVFVDSGIGVLNVMSQGGCTISNCTFIGGHYYWSGTAWVGCTAIQTYWPVKLVNCTFVAMPGQGTPPTTIAGAETYPSGMIASGGAWNNGGTPPWTAPPAGTPLLTATNCTIAGTWPGTAFSGASPAAPPGQLPAGFRQVQAISYDPAPVVNAVISGQLSQAAGVAQIHAAVQAIVVAN